MNELPKRKTIRIKGYDYSTAGAYFITICTANREEIFWSDGRGELCSPDCPQLTDIGTIVDNEIRKIDGIYDVVDVEKYCVMPNHIHMLLVIRSDADGRTQFAPTVSRVVKQFKGSITKQIGKPI